MSGRLCEISGETCRRGDGGRSQSLHSTDRKTLLTEANLTERMESKAMLREGRQEGGYRTDGKLQARASLVPERAIQVQRRQSGVGPVSKRISERTGCCRRW